MFLVLSRLELTLLMLSSERASHSATAAVQDLLKLFVQWWGILEVFEKCLIKMDDGAKNANETFNKFNDRSLRRPQVINYS